MEGFLSHILGHLEFHIIHKVNDSCIFNFFVVIVRDPSSQFCTQFMLHVSKLIGLDSYFITRLLGYELR
jgi:hypothetical protein